MIHTAYAWPLYDVAAEPLRPATSKVWARLGTDGFGYSWKRRMGRYFWSDYFDVDVDGVLLPATRLLDTTQ